MLLHNGNGFLTAVMLQFTLCCTTVHGYSAEWRIVEQWNAIPAGPSKDIDSLKGCQELCENTTGCTQFTWNYGHKPAYYCFLSSSKRWSGVRNGHITSGCIANEVTGCGTTPQPSPPPPPPPSPPPPPFTPRWTAQLPNASKGPTWGYPLLAPESAEHRYVYFASSKFGTYNHGPMITFYDDHYFMQWYNGVKSESVDNRVLYATSTDAKEWSEPRVMFNTTGSIGLENEPAVIIEGRMYAVAGSWDVFKRTGGGAEHTGPDTPLMRRVLNATHLGPVFWLGDTVPAGFEHFNYPTANSTTLSAQTRADAAAYVAALVDAEPLSDAGKPNERVMYELPGDRRRLMMLLRAGGAMPFGAPPGMLASTCVLGAWFYHVLVFCPVPPKAHLSPLVEQMICLLTFKGYNYSVLTELAQGPHTGKIRKSRGFTWIHG
eukprot:m.1420530 g.1420530  ORF g.1420530 m.1420530 type:complete len:432 (+) comp25045_c1_seq39:380-1675(+)